MNQGSLPDKCSNGNDSKESINMSTGKTLKKMIRSLFCIGMLISLFFLSGCTAHPKNAAASGVLDQDSSAVDSTQHFSSTTGTKEGTYIQDTDAQADDSQTSLQEETTAANTNAEQEAEGDPTQTIGGVTEEQAGEIVQKALVDVLKDGDNIRFDHIDDTMGENYFVFQYFRYTPEDSAGNAMAETYAWFYVEEHTGELYLMDFVNGSLTKYVPGESQIE